MAFVCTESLRVREPAESSATVPDVVVPSVKLAPVTLTEDAASASATNAPAPACKVIPTAVKEAASAELSLRCVPPVPLAAKSISEPSASIEPSRFISPTTCVAPVWSNTPVVLISVAFTATVEAASMSTPPAELILTASRAVAVVSTLNV